MHILLLLLHQNGEPVLGTVPVLSFDLHFCLPFKFSADCHASSIHYSTIAGMLIVLIAGIPCALNHNSSALAKWRFEIHIKYKG